MDSEGDQNPVSDADKQQKDLGKLAGKYLTFQLGAEEYGIQILRVQEIIQMQDITFVPQTPDYFKGLINLRGKVIPVLDLRIKFGLDSCENTERTCVVVVQYEVGTFSLAMGLVIDEVSEVVNIGEDQIEPPPPFGLELSEDYILGMGKVNTRVIIILHIDKVILDSEISDHNGSN